MPAHVDDISAPDDKIIVTRVGRFDKPRIRRALLDAFDQDEFMEAVISGDTSLRQTSCGFFPPLSAMARSAGLPTLTRKQDDAQMRRNLNAAQYAGETIVPLPPQDIPNQKAPTAIAAEMMRRIRMNTDDQAIDRGNVMQRRANRGAAGSRDWDGFVTRFVGSEVFSLRVNTGLRRDGGSAWFGWPSSSRIEDSRESWFDGPNLAERAAHARRADPGASL